MKIKQRKRRRRGSPPDIKFDVVPCPRADLKGPCHVFLGGKHRGYGRVWCGKNMLVHVYVWEQKHGPVPDDRVLDHQCRNRGCCNVDHLRVVTRKINVRENVVGHRWQLGKAKTHCLRGHPLYGDNVRITRAGTRVCKTCDRNRQRVKVATGK